MTNEQYWKKRQKMIDRIEGYCGTLGPMNRWTTEEIERLYDAIIHKVAYEEGS